MQSEKVAEDNPSSTEGEEEVKSAGSRAEPVQEWQEMSEALDQGS